MSTKNIFSGLASLNSLTAISVVRYLTVVRPFNMGDFTYNRIILIISKSCTRLFFFCHLFFFLFWQFIRKRVQSEFLCPSVLSFLSVGSWSFAALWSLAPLVGWSNYVPESTGSYCSVNWLDEDSRSYITCIFLFEFIIPIMIICFSYGKVLAKIKEVIFRGLVPELCSFMV